MRTPLHNLRTWRLGLRLCALAAIFLCVLEFRVQLMLWAQLPVSIFSEVAPLRSGFIDGKISRFDPVLGFRLNPGSYHVIRMFGREILFDSHVHVNRQGYQSEFDFTEKKSPGTFRIGVLGDSFTSGNYVSVPWPSRATDRLRARNIELYSFAMEGTGARTWYPLFFKEIVPHYELDALILQTSTDFLIDGPHFIRHSTATETRQGYYDDIPDEETFRATFDQRSIVAERIVGESDIQHQYSWLSAWKWSMPRPRLIQKAMRTTQAWLAGSPPTPGSAPRPWRKRAFKDNYERLIAIVDYAQKRKIPTLIAVTPVRETWATMRESAKPPLPVTEMSEFASGIGAAFFDGYLLYDDLPVPMAKRKYWLKYDEHWNQAGSDRFAEKIAEYITTHWQTRRDISGN